MTSCRNHRNTTYRSLLSETDDRPLRQRSDLDVAELARTGCQDALAELVHRNYIRSHRLALSIIPNPAVADDVISASFAKAFLHIGQFAGESAFSSWFSRIVINECYQHMRTARDKVHVSVDSHLSEVSTMRSPLTDPETQAGSDELVRIVNMELNRVPALLRRPLVLRLQQRTILEIATELGISEGAVKSRVHRAKEFLRARLERHLPKRYAPGENCA